MRGKIHRALAFNFLSKWYHMLPAEKKGEYDERVEFLFLILHILIILLILIALVVLVNIINIANTINSIIITNSIDIFNFSISNL